MIEMKCCDILGTRILVTNMADTVDELNMIWKNCAENISAWAMSIRR